MIRITANENCCGCSACAAICPKNCISMEQDTEGFFYPNANAAQCVDCGLCEKVCPVSAKPHISVDTPAAYAIINPDENVRKNSSSGGVFSLLALKILQQGGVVFGAALMEDMQICHIAVEEAKDLYRLQGSKYVQSQIGDTYSQAKVFLQSGRQVLFTGTPCQIAGLKTYLGKTYDNLLCQDLICHGAPSPAVWRRYIAYRESIAGSNAKKVSFRHKESGWTNYSMYIEFTGNGRFRASKEQDPYLQAFLHDLCLRPSCYNCAFKGINRTADITLADFWGVWDLMPEMYDKQGTSLVILHSHKGVSALRAIEKKLKIVPVELEKALLHNKSMVKSSNRPQNREAFLSEIQTNDFSATVTKYVPKKPFMQKYVNKAKRIIKKILRKL